MSQIPGTNTEEMAPQGIIVINTLGMERKEVVAIEVPKGQQTIDFQDKVRSLKLISGQGIQEVPIQFIEGDHKVEEPLMKQSDRIEFIYDFKPFEIIFGYFHDAQSKNRKEILINESEDCITVQKRDETFTIDKHTGHIDDYSWKGRKILKKGSAALKAYADMENVWEIQHNFRDWEMEWEVISAPIVKEHGPVRSTIEYKTKFEDGESVFINQYIFYHNMEGFEAKVMVDWKDPAIFIKMEYLPTTDSKYSIAEIPGAAIKRKIKPAASHDKVRWENNCQTFV